MGEGNAPLQFADTVAANTDGKRYRRPASAHFNSTCPPEFRVKKVTIAKMLAYLQDLPSEDADEEAGLLAVTGAAIETATSGKSATLVEGSQARLLTWKQQATQVAYVVEHRKVLCYPGCVGTVPVASDRPDQIHKK